MATRRTFAVGDIHGCLDALRPAARSRRVRSVRGRPAVRRRPRQPRTRLARCAALRARARGRGHGAARQPRPAPAGRPPRRAAAVEEGHVRGDPRRAGPRRPDGLAGAPPGAARRPGRTLGRGPRGHPRLLEPGRGAPAREPARASARGRGPTLVPRAHVRRRTGALAERERQARAAALDGQRVHAHALLPAPTAPSTSRSTSPRCTRRRISCPGTACRARPGPARSTCRCCSATGRRTRRWRRPGSCRLDRGCVWGGSLACLRVDGPGETMRTVVARSPPRRPEASP